jgi:hypothetical protein
MEYLLPDFVPISRGVHCAKTTKLVTHMQTKPPKLMFEGQPLNTGEFEFRSRARTEGSSETMRTAHYRKNIILTDNIIIA